ncbi:MAG: mandelate racemase/muconate lactonizing enzyme family protein, partial [Anaerolineae bacterium]|nr:mandelate racemase/muconate lactonizing enzyme family protein [Anaerolineae bacterium]
MRITRIEILESKEPLILPEPWKAAWTGPLAAPVASFSYAFVKVYTDEGLVGIGPNTNCAQTARLIGYDPFRVEAFWQQEMSGRRAGSSGRGAAGIEIALWDLIGKAAGQPLAHLLGVDHPRQLVYAATSRLMTPEEMAEHVIMLRELGFRAVKLRLHRLDPAEDLAVVEAVRMVVGDEVMILVDANQNNHGEGYPFWSRRTAQRMAQALDALDVYYLEEPLPRQDVEGLADIAASVDMFIAGGEHTPTLYDWREHLLSGAYDIIQPDVILGGNYGIGGVRKAALLADYFGR